LTLFTVSFQVLAVRRIPRTQTAREVSVHLFRTIQRVSSVEERARDLTRSDSFQPNKRRTCKFFIVSIVRVERRTEHLSDTLVSFSIFRRAASLHHINSCQARSNRVTQAVEVLDSKHNAKHRLVFSHETAASRESSAHTGSMHQPLQTSSMKASPCG
jgi:hypothetical protein